MSRDIELGTDVSPHANELEVVGSYLHTISEIEGQVATAPPSDVEFHKLALDSVRSRTREYLTERPALVEFYRVSGEWAVAVSSQSLVRERTSAEQLITYVKNGLLDSLTIEELENRVAGLTAKLTVVSQVEAVQAMFGDLLAPPAEPTVPTEQPAEQLPAPSERGSALAASVENIMSILTTDQFPAPVLSVVRAALQGDAALTRMRTHDPAIAALSDKEYTAFKQSLTAQRAEIIELLKSHGLEAAWHEFGQTRGRYYQLHVVGLERSVTDTDGDVRKPAPKKAAQSKPATEPDQEQYRPARTQPDTPEKFEAELLGIVGAMLGTNMPYMSKEPYIVTRVAEWLDISKEHASDLVTNLISKGNLVQARIEMGSAVLEMGTLPVEDKPRTTRRQPKTEKVAAKTGFDAEDIAASHQLCHLLAATGSPDRGLKMADIAAHLDINERAARSFVQRLAKVGICKVQKTWVRGGALTAGQDTIKFPSEGAFTRFQKDPHDYLAVLAAANNESN